MQPRASVADPGAAHGIVAPKPPGRPWAGIVQSAAGPWSLGAAGLIALLLLWQLGHVSVPAEQQKFLPSPLQVVAALWVLLTEKGFIFDIFISLGRILLSFFIASAIALPLGILMGSSAVFRNFFGPVISGARYLPAASFVPLLLVWFGPTNAQKLALLVLGVIFFLIALIQDNAASVPKELIESSKTMGASDKRVVWDVIVPSSMPANVLAMRNMIAVSWTYLVIAEITAASDGIGAVMMRAGRFLNVDVIMAGILTIGVLGVLTDFAFKAASYLLFPWQHARKG